MNFLYHEPMDTLTYFSTYHPLLTYSKLNNKVCLLSISKMKL